MSSPADLGERIGIPSERLEELLQLPIVTRALVVAAEHPDMTASGVWKSVGRPTLYKEGRLDLDALLVELAKRTNVMTRNSDGKIIEQRAGHPMIMGRLKLAESQAQRRIGVIYEVEDLLTKHSHEPQAMNRAREILRTEVEQTLTGGRP
jgi:hypothetical protein